MRRRLLFERRVECDVRSLLSLYREKRSRCVETVCTCIPDKCDLKTIDVTAVEFGCIIPWDISYL